jgi:hypothetical protein
LKHGMPMLEYEAHKELFDILNFEENLKMHWTYLASWAMVQHMHNMVLEVTIFIIIASYYISLTCDKVNTIDNHN